MTELTLRRATHADVDLYFEWANDPDVRRYSFTHDMIGYQDHIDWFALKIADPATHLFLLLADGTPVGQIRFLVSGVRAELSFSIAREFRGRGLARHLVKLGAAAMNDLGAEIVIAKVKPDNQASIAVFLDCGFSEIEASAHQKIYERTRAQKPAGNSHTFKDEAT
jgi:RimJ/RimL family protein N-acetyltransferase